MERSGEVQTRERAEVVREAVTMMLYVSILLLAELTALPKAGYGGQEIHGWGLAGLVWGTASGIALAHWFSFRLAAQLLSTGHVREIDMAIGAAEVMGAAVIALLTTIPVVLVGDDSEIEAMVFVPALTVGAAGFATAKTAGRSAWFALVLGFLVMCAGFLVAAAKNWLVGH